MSGKHLFLTVVASLVLAACAHSDTPAREAAMSGTAAYHYDRLQPVKEWPLRFKSHKFSVHCYDTYGCTVHYAGHRQRSDDPNELRPSSAGYGPDYHRNWGGGHGMIPNFPPPAQVSWRSRDGQAHTAEIDIGAIFRDQLIRHNVPREEMADVPDGEHRNEPAIILEVNDRTIRIWMRAFISTKQLQKPGNQYSNFRNDLILAETYTY